MSTYRCEHHSRRCAGHRHIEFIDAIILTKSLSIRYLYCTAKYANNLLCSRRFFGDIQNSTYHSVNEYYRLHGGSPGNATKMETQNFQSWRYCYYIPPYLHFFFARVLWLIQPSFLLDAIIFPRTFGKLFSANSNTEGSILLTWVWTQAPIKSDLRFIASWGILHRRVSLLSLSTLRSNGWS